MFGFHNRRIHHIPFACDTHDVDAFLLDLPDNQPVIANPLLKSGFILPIAFLQPAAALLGS